ncbi:unnamed protein product [Dibothriocephalus latus]|uniref:Uncharacterized protein n=1 Tax=Dibothriocephalus latus TaxID=60516 RepID=A0A3P7MQG6_DIBLA|nr:unnamed protein product [Dibothriocephalus latus]
MKAKRQMQQEIQHSAPTGPLIGPQMPTPMETGGGGASAEDVVPPSPDA